MKQLLVSGLALLLLCAAGCSVAPVQPPAPAPQAEQLVQEATAPTPTSVPLEPQPADWSTALWSPDYVPKLYAEEGLPLPADPEALARHWGLSSGETAQLSGSDLAAVLEYTGLPQNFLHSNADGTLSGASVSYFVYPELPMGGEIREAAAFLLSYYPDTPCLLFFLHEIDGWQLREAFSLTGMRGFRFQFSDYSEEYAGATHSSLYVNELSADVLLIAAPSRGNTWLVTRETTDGTGYLRSAEYWYNLYTQKVEVFAVLIGHEVEWDTEDYIAGIVKAHDLSMLTVVEEVSHFDGDSRAEGAEENYGVWVKSYIFNDETFSLELKQAQFLEGRTLAYARLAD